MSQQKWKAIATLSESQITELCQMYQQEWWSQGRKQKDVEKMLEHSDVIIALCDPKTLQLVAFARIITDFVYRGFILDVIVTSAYRGQGLGRKLLEAIVNHPPIKEVETLILFCQPNMVEFYQKWGFSEEIEDIRLMANKTLD